jgi:hypothetical protein
MASLLFSKLFDEMGVPAGYSFKQLLFSPRANSVVRHASSAMNDWRPERIYFHRVGRVSPSWQSWGIGFARISFHTFFETTACVHDDAARLFNRSRRPRTTPHKLAFSSDRRLIKRLGGPLDRPGIVAGTNRLHTLLDLRNRGVRRAGSIRKDRLVEERELDRGFRRRTLR